MNEQESDLGSFLAGFIIGALVGAATALILAPQSGQTTREQLTGFSADLRHASSERIDQVRHSADSYSREYRDKATSLFSDARSRAQHLTDQVQEQTRIVLDAGREAAERGAAGVDNSHGDSLPGSAAS
ncbi:YtxH domain-containing protein [Promineifilum sp.]|uniref:YtxH domain-containing protein n=1 Tax=Promineifilum sp. TaxID=2664178 RepID=UPI0035AEB62D